MVVSEALTLTETRETYDITAKIHGGGVSGQAGALRMAIARSLLEIDPESRPALKKAGLLTRDSRKKDTRSTASRRPARHRSSRSADPAPDQTIQVGTSGRRMKFGTDGVRGIAGTELTAEFSLRLGRAAARVLGGPAATTVVLGGDTRVDADTRCGAVGRVRRRRRRRRPPRRGPDPDGRLRGAASRSDGGDGLRLAQPYATTASSCSPPADQAVRRRRSGDRAGTRTAAASVGEPGSVGAGRRISPRPYVDHVLAGRGGRRPLVAHRRRCGQRCGAPLVPTCSAPRCPGHRDRRRTERHQHQRWLRRHRAGCLAAAVLEHGADLGIALDGDADRLIAVDTPGRSSTATTSSPSARSTCAPTGRSATTPWR